jgi:hypothetical protein
VDYLIIDVSAGLEKKRNDIKNVVEKYNFCLLRGVVDPKSISNGVGKIKSYVERHEDAAVTGEDSSKVKNYFMKLSIGEGRHSGKSINLIEDVVRPRLKRDLYCPINQGNLFDLDQSFKEVAKVRNFLMGIALDYGIDDNPSAELWTASRVHHFPTGGGFMSSHKDTVAPRVLADNAVGMGFFQPILVMSQKGVDYETGGGFAVIDDKIVVYEDFAEVGDIAVYNAATEHGCMEIDTHRPFLQRSGEGRYSGLVTLYKNLDKSKN